MIEELTKILPKEENLDNISSDRMYDLFMASFITLIVSKDPEFQKLNNMKNTAYKIFFVIVYDYFIINNPKLWDTIIAESLQHETKRRLNANH